MTKICKRCGFIKPANSCVMALGPNSCEVVYPFTPEWPRKGYLYANPRKKLSFREKITIFGIFCCILLLSGTIYRLAVFLG